MPIEGGTQDVPIAIVWRLLDDTAADLPTGANPQTGASDHHPEAFPWRKATQQQEPLPEDKAAEVAAAAGLLTAAPSKGRTDPQPSNRP